MIDLSQVILDLEGKPCIISAKEKDELTLKKGLILALLHGEDQSKRLTTDEVLDRHELAFKLQRSEKVKLKAEHVSLLKKLIAGLTSNVSMSCVVAGQLIQALDPIEKEEGDQING